MFFSTKDRDNDTWSKHCAREYRYGGWWYKACAHSNLNGMYNNGKNVQTRYNIWTHWPGGNTNMKKSSLMVRRA